MITGDNYTLMIDLAKKFEDGVCQIIKKIQSPLARARIGARVEYLFQPKTPRNGGEAHHGRHGLLEAY